MLYLDVLKSGLLYSQTYAQTWPRSAGHFVFCYVLYSVHVSVFILEV